MHAHTTVLQPCWILSGMTQVNWHQKGKTRKVKAIWIYWNKRQWWQWHQLGHMQTCTLTQTNNHDSIHHSVFLQARCPSCCPTNSVKALKAKLKYIYILRNKIILILETLKTVNKNNEARYVTKKAVSTQITNETVQRMM